MSEGFIPLSVPNLKGKELEYVTEAVRSEWVSTAGSYVSDFEASIADYVGARGAVACQSGTAGIHTALILAGVKPDDLVIVPTLTFIAAVNPVKYLNADPVFMDCDDSLCIDPSKVRAFCAHECEMRNGVLFHKASNRRVSALVVVHVFGNMADMGELMETAHEFNLMLIEDATEALGTYYEEGPFAGSYAGTIGDIGIYSFNGNKIITTGGGGMIVSRSDECLTHAKHLTTQAKSDPLYYEHDEVGYNYRLTNLQAALGLAQMEQLNKFIETKNENYEYYKHLLESIEGVSLLGFREGVNSNKWFYSLLCEDPAIDRDALISFLQTQDIQTRPIWGLIHEQAPYEGAITYQITEAPKYRSKVVNLPCSTNLEKKDIDRVVAAIEEAIA